MELYGTLGPACQSPALLEGLFLAGMTGVRLNLSHTTLKSSEGQLNDLFKAGASAGIAPKLLIDLQGAEMRIGALSAPLTLREGACVSIPLDKGILSACEKGDLISLDDGKLLVQAEAPEESSLYCRVLRGGLLGSRKSIVIQGKTVLLPALTEQDEKALKELKDYNVSGVMVPFARAKKDLLLIRSRLKGQNVLVLAKIESRAGLEKLPELLEECDQCVIARGDLGNAVGLPCLPAVQKNIAKECKAAGRPFIVATELLSSMVGKAVPTRAEVSDIFNAVLDGAAGLMLTNETAVGQYPVAAMDCLFKTAAEGLAYLG